MQRNLPAKPANWTRFSNDLKLDTKGLTSTSTSTATHGQSAVARNKRYLFQKSINIHIFTKAFHTTRILGKSEEEEDEQVKINNTNKNYREELSLTIPVTSTNIGAFCNQKGEFRYTVIAKQIADFVKSELVKFDISIDKLPFNFFNEITSNAYDAYAMQGLKAGENLVIKVVVQQKNDKIFVKIKNNGNLFAEQPSGTFFQRSQIKYDNKRPILGLIGGYKMGLKMIEDALKEVGGKLLLRNRKRQPGAAVCIEFNLKNDKSSQPKFNKP